MVMIEAGYVRRRVGFEVRGTQNLPLVFQNFEILFQGSAFLFQPAANTTRCLCLL